MPVLDNPRHERFAQELAKGKTADEAYVLAGYEANRGNATRMNANESISGRIAELQNRAAERAVVTMEDISRQLDEDRDFAHKVGSASAAVAATMGKAKLHGFLVERSENVNHNYDISDEPMTEEEWASEHATEH